MIKEKGITLIALVVTIIVLLILAGVTISLVLGQNGIFSKATEAKKATEIAQEKEQVQLAIVEAKTNKTTTEGTTLKAELQKSIDKTYPGAKVTQKGKEYVIKLSNGHEYEIDENGNIIGSTIGTPIEEAKPGEIVSGDNKQYTNKGTAMIPVGFAIVPGCEDVSQGLVISDVANDIENVGNQFVWIPVNSDYFETEFTRKAGYENLLQGTLDGMREIDGTGNISGIAEDEDTKAEAKAMYASVKTNGGFYIARYEAGKDASENMIVKKNQNIYNNIKWGNSLTDSKGGAVEVARKFAIAQGYNTAKVHSTLCYGVQWDMALKFIDPEWNSYTKDSTGQGWYSDNYKTTTEGNTTTNPNKKTGIDLIYSKNSNIIANKQKNIYDMAGNVSEWTMEVCVNGFRVPRGGYCNSNGDTRPASHRYEVMPADRTDPYLGFRVALYL